MMIGYIAIAFLVLFLVLLFRKPDMDRRSPEGKGKIGEQEVSDLLEYVKGKEGRVLNNLIIPGKNGMSSQIDHVLISTKGVFVVETKALSGRIYGTPKQEKWTQVLGYGKEKHQFYSPIKQNETHINRLRPLIDDFEIRIHNIVIFTEADTSRLDIDNVFTPREFRRYFKKLPKDEMSEEAVKEMVGVLIYYKDNPIETDEEHATKVQQAKQFVEEGRCPRCGGELIKRQSKDGKSFYGCSGYPKCRFTKKIKASDQAD